MRRYNYNNVKNVKTTCKVGEITPVFWREVLPGDYTKVDMKNITRMVTPLVPILDAPFIDLYSFYVPKRVLMGRKLSVKEPSLKAIAPNNVFTFENAGPSNSESIFTAYFLNKGTDENSTFDDFLKWVKSLDDATIKKYFKGSHIYDVLGSSYSKDALVEQLRVRFSNNNLLQKFGLLQSTFFKAFSGDVSTERMALDASYLLVYHKICDDFFRNTDIEVPMHTVSFPTKVDKNTVNAYDLLNEGSDNVFLLFTRRAPKKSSFLNSLYLNNPLSISSSNGSTIGERLFQKLQYDNRVLEAKGRLANAPYREVMQKIFREKFTDPDGAQFLGHYSFNQTVQEVTATAASKSGGDNFFLGDVGGKSVTYNECSNLINSSFKEPGYVMVVAIPRFRVSFNNGLDYETFGKTGNDLVNEYYQPNLKASPFRAVLTYELRSELFPREDDEILAYTDSFNDYRTVNSAICGQFKNKNMDMWHFSENNPAGVYSESLLKVNEEPLLRTLSTSLVDPFFMEFNWEMYEQRIVPPVSVIDSEHRES